MLYDARGHGESEPAFITYGYHEKYDAEAIIKFMNRQTGLEPEQIGLVGTISLLITVELEPMVLNC